MSSIVAISRIKQSNYVVELVFIIIAFILLFYKSLFAPYVAIAFLFYSIIRSNLYENVFSFIVYFPYVLGYIFNPIGVYHVGGIVKYIGVLLLLIIVFMKKARINNIVKSIVPLIILLFVFTLSAITTYGGNYALPKLLSTIRHAVVLYLAFVMLFSNIKQYDFSKLGVFYIVLATYLLPMALVNNGISGPDNFLDFGFLRVQTHEDFYVLDEDEDYHIGYQMLGYLILQGLGFFMIEYRKHSSFLSLLIFALVLLVTLYTGSRQAIVSVIVMLLIWTLLYNHHKKEKNNSILFRNVIVLFFVFAFLLYMINILTSEGGMLQSVAEEGYVEGGGRGEWLMSGIEQFQDHPLWGVGFGRFKISGYYGSYPHNLFIELLCETGLFGFLIATIFVLYFAYRYKRYLPPFVLLWVAYFLRSMASGGIPMNVVVFIMLFTIASIRRNDLEKILNNRE